MNLPKALLPLLVATAGLGGCVYEEYDTGYREPRHVYHGGYVERDVVVHRRPTYYDDDRRDYHRARPVTVYQEPARVHYHGQPQVYGGGYGVIHRERGESLEDARRREIREHQRAVEEHHDKKKDHDDDHKKKKKKDHDD